MYGMERHRIRQALPPAALWLGLGAVLAWLPAHAAMTEPTLGHIAPGAIERVVAQARNAPQAIEEDLDAMAASREAYETARAAGGPQADNESTHYARGSTLIMHVFIDWYGSQFANGTWDEASRSEAAGKAYLAKQFYLDVAPAGANLSFDNQNTTTYWYVSAFWPGYMGEVTWEIANSALQQNGVVDIDGDGLLADNFSLGLQNWNGGWDNVIVMFEPAGSADGRPHGEYAVSTVMIYTDNSWNTWAHEWGHVFGACDEYIDGQTGMCGLEDCGSCPLTTYCDELYYNGNCDLACGAPGNPCIMKYGAESACGYTRQAWSWEDEDANGQLDWVRRYDDNENPYNIMEMWPNGYFYHNTTSHSFAAHVSTPGWTVFGLRSPIGTDYDLDVYADNNLTYHLAASAWGGQNVDFVVGDYHMNRTGIEHVRVSRFSGAAANYNVVWEGGGGVLYPDGIARPQNWIAGNVVRAYDLPLFGGETVTIEADVTSGALDIGMALFNSFGSTYFAGRTSATWLQDGAGIGGTETYTYTVPGTDVYGLVVWTNIEAAGTFTLRIGPSPVTLVEETPGFSALSLRLFNYDPSVPYWAVAGSRPDAGGALSLRLCEDPEYQTTMALSNEPGSELDLVAVNYAAKAINRDHLRVSNTGGTGFRTEWEQSADLSSGYLSGSWTSSHVAKVWDVYLESGKLYYFREYHPTNFLPKLDTGLYLFAPGGDPTLAKSQAADGSDQYGVSQGERFLFAPGTTGFHGLSLVMNNNATDTYSIWWGPRLTLNDNQMQTSSNEIAYGYTPVISTDWVVWGARPARGDEVRAWMFGTDGDYASWETSSLNAENVNVLVSDRNHLPTVEGVYTRFLRSSGSGPVDYEYEGGTGESLPYTEGAAEVVNKTWETNDVVEGFDLHLTGSRTEPAYVEIRVIPLSPNLDLGVALFRSSTELDNYYQGLGQAEVVSAGNGIGETEALVYETEVDDWFGVVVWNEERGGGDYQIQILGSPVVATEDAPAMPLPLALRTGANPVRGPASLSFDLPAAGAVAVDVFDVAGRRLRTLVDGALSAGMHDVTWDGRDDRGAATGAGVYLVRLRTAEGTRTVKLVRSGT